MKVLFDKIAVKCFAPAERIGSLYVPPSSNESQVTVGQVESIGTGVVFVQLGDHVFFNKYTSLKVVKDGTEYFVLREPEVIAVV